MKKILALILALCLLCGAVALADTTTIDQNSESQEVDVPLTLEIGGDGYEVIIPSALNFVRVEDGETEGNVFYKAEDTITVTKARMDEGSLVIYTASEDGFALTNESDESIEYGFDCSVLDGDGEILENKEMVVYRNKTCEFRLTFTTGSMPEADFPIGSFEDSVTFTVALEG